MSFNKIFIAAFVVVFIIAGILFTIFFYTTAQSITITNNKFQCNPPNSDVRVGYVYMHGYGDHNISAFDYQRSLIVNKPILDFDYNETKYLADISVEFIQKFYNFTLQNQMDKIIIFGQSAGGVIAVYSLNYLDFDGIIELHTLASPLNGYHASDDMLGNITGFGRQIGFGFGRFKKAGDNIVVYHHKTVDDKSLRARCGAFTDYYCDPLEIQNNNFPGSTEFYYPDETHLSIVRTVSKMVIECNS